MKNTKERLWRYDGRFRRKHNGNDERREAFVQDGSSHDFFGFGFVALQPGNSFLRPCAARLSCRSTVSSIRLLSGSPRERSARRRGSGKRFLHGFRPPHDYACIYFVGAVRLVPRCRVHFFSARLRKSFRK